MCKLKYDETINLKDNAMLKVKPSLFYEWDSEKNGELNIYEITKGSHKKVWWICGKCGISYIFEIRRKLEIGMCVGCFKNENKDIVYLKDFKPELAKQWHPIKNGELSLNSISLGSSRKVWWLGECGHEWEAVVGSRVAGADCPYCSNQKTLIGFNDIHTTNPTISKSLANYEDGFKYTQGSNVKVEIKCHECESYIGYRALCDALTYGISCPKCSDGKSYPEKFMINLFSCLGLEILHDYSFDWSQGKRYDFYIPSHNTIIEIHGGQHYNGRFATLGGNTLEDEIINDEYKKQLAFTNDIDKYIVIDARKSDLHWIKTNIINSELNEMFDIHALDFLNIHENSIKSLVIEVSKEYGQSNITVRDISKKYNITIDTVYRYLKIGYELGFTEFYQDKQKIEYACHKGIIRKVVQLSLINEYINEFDSIKNAVVSNFGEYIRSKTSGITSCCKGNIKQAYGFKWMYKEDFESIIKNKIS